MTRFLVNENFREIVVAQLLTLGYKDKSRYGGSLPFAPWVHVNIANRTFRCRRFIDSPGTIDYWHQLRWDEFLTIHKLHTRHLPLDAFITTLDRRYQGLSCLDFPK